MLSNTVAESHEPHVFVQSEVEEDMKEMEEIEYIRTATPLSQHAGSPPFTLTPPHAGGEVVHILLCL